MSEKESPKQKSVNPLLLPMVAILLTLFLVGLVLLVAHLSRTEMVSDPEPSITATAPPTSSEPNPSVTTDAPVSSGEAEGGADSEVVPGQVGPGAPVPLQQHPQQPLPQPRQPLAPQPGAPQPQPQPEQTASNQGQPNQPQQPQVPQVPQPTPGILGGLIETAEGIICVVYCP